MKQLNRKTVDGKAMYKYLFSIPPDLIKELNWDNTKEYVCRIRDDKLIIEKI